MTKMKLSKEEIEKFQTLDEFEKEIFSEDEIKDIHTRAHKRSQTRNEMSDEISRALIEYMAENHLGFNQFKKKLNISSATLAKVLKGSANLTLDTIAEIIESTGLRIKISIMKHS